MEFHNAVLALYPNTANIDHPTETIPATVKDRDGNVIDIDMDAVEAEIARQQPQVKLDALRAERNQRLANTDWWASSDLTMTEAQTAYRQALRDITETYTSLDDVVWPEKP